jgi:ABC-2 type transport system permease protein
MNWRAIRAIMRKDLKQVLQNRMVWMPMIVLPLIIQNLLPLLMVFLPTITASLDSEIEDLQPLLKSLPGPMRATFEGLTGADQWMILVANHMFSPLFLMVPLMVSSILAADSFAGEKERRTMEGLFYTPISDMELFTAKVLTALVPAQVISITSFVLYGISVNLLGYRTIGHVFFPSPVWWPLVFWLGPAVSLLGLGATVLVSSRAKTFVQAQQISGILVLPIVFLMVAQSSGVLFLSAVLTIAFGALLWPIGLWLVWVGARTFSRDAFVTRM